MEDNEKKVDLANNLIQKALAGKHDPVELLTSLNEYFAAKKVASGLKKITNGFIKMKDELFNTYCAQLKTDDSDIELVLAIRDVASCIDFYQIEYDNIIHAREEFKMYMMTGHFLNMLLGNKRPEEDMVDILAAIENKDQD